MIIKDLFDPSRNIYRTIEKVITYNAAHEARLRAEIAEYIVTERIEDQFERLLDKMELAMEQGGQNEVGVWVSGFYGSGKSSFTKYLGLALDQSIQVDGVPFLKHLQNRMQRPTTRARLAATAARYPAAVVMLDLASEMLAGATMEDVSSVLYYKVLQWAGYSRNLKVAALERRLQKDGFYPAFAARVEAALGLAWADVQNDPLVIDSLLPEIAHEFYPELFKSATAFSAETADFVRFENERVAEMIEIVRRTSGKAYVIFIIDEVGQYVGSRQHLILNLDGLAKNLKNIGDGKVWIIGTAQQTLTEDDPKAALNSPELFKLAARFPIQIELESDDIKEICHRRLLGKSPQGEKLLGEWFDRHGQALRHNTRLQDARAYDSDFDRETFVNLYPFLPAHFGILLHLLGALAMSTGGIGLRSAIKVVQDILIEESGGQAAAAEQTVGWLATTATLYDALEKDIRRAEPSIHRALEKALMCFPNSPPHQQAAKTVAVLQILGNMPVTAHNVACLLHPRVEAASSRDQIEAALADLINAPLAPLGEKDGHLCFFSEKINDIEQQRAQLALRNVELLRIHNEALRQVFSPLPSARLHGSLAVSSGLKANVGGRLYHLAGERETIQMVVELAEADGYETARLRLVEESRARSAQHTIYLLGRSSPDMAARSGEIYRCQEIVNLHRNDPDQEVRDYCAGQAARALKLMDELQHSLVRSLSRGSFIFHAQATAVEALATDLRTAAARLMADVAGQVFERYAEAPLRVETTLAEKFLRVGNLKAITSTLDPLGLVQVSAGAPRIQTDHKALLSIRDALDRNGTLEGRRLTDMFSDAPFGWSPDTVRYLIAALLTAGEIKLKVSGREVTVNGQQAIEALRTNNAFKPVGVALRDERPSNQVLARAAERLTDLIGDLVIPLEDEISRAAARHFPVFQHRFGPLAERLRGLGLAGVERVRSLNRELADVLLTDASDAPQRLGGESSGLYEALKWAMEVDGALNQGLETTLRDLQRGRREIELLPDWGAPGELRAELADDLALLGERLEQERFYRHAADLNTLLTTIQARARAAALKLADAQQAALRQAGQDLQRLAEWAELTHAEQAGMLARLDELDTPVEPGLDGLRRLLNQDYAIRTLTAALRREIEQLGRQRQMARKQADKERQAAEHALHNGHPKLERSLSLPARLRSAAELAALIERLQSLADELGLYTEIDVTFEIEA